MGSKLPYLLAIIFTVVSFIFCTIAYGTGYWYESVDEDSQFVRLGLWEACFNGYEHTSDLIGKAYYGCWWVFHKEYSYIKSWIMPSWFIAVQTLMTFALVFEFIGLVTVPLAGLVTKNVRILVVACVISYLMSACLIVSVVVFGVMIGEDRTWMPRPDRNVLGWAYGLAVLSGFSSVFCTISLTVYTLMVKYETMPKNREAEKHAPMIPKV